MILIPREYLSFYDPVDLSSSSIDKKYPTTRLDPYIAIAYLYIYVAIGQRRGESYRSDATDRISDPSDHEIWLLISTSYDIYIIIDQSRICDRRECCDDSIYRLLYTCENSSGVTIEI